MRSNEYTNIHFCAQKVAIQDDVDWCLDFIAEHYRCEMNHVTPDSVGEKAEGVYEKARQRGLVAQSHNAGRPRKLSATPDLSGTVLPLCPIPNSASKSAPSFNSVKLKAS
ncbi:MULTISPECIES: hypothetical protein, partial [unclassified Pseudomonas]